MKYLLSILIIFGLIANLYSQNGAINQVDANKLKQGLWIVKDSSGTKTISEGKYVNNKKTGIWKNYYPSGKIENEITFVSGRANGFAKFYYDNGNLMEQGIWKGNKWTGEYKYFHKNGKQYYDWNYNDKGKREGEQKYFHDNGQLMIEGKWANGKEAGVVKEYTREGVLKSEKVFNDGKIDVENSKFHDPKNPEAKSEAVKTENKEKEIVRINENPNKKVGVFDGNGFYTLFNKQKLKDREGDWKNGKLMDGKQFHYNADGKLVKVSVYKGGQLVDVIWLK